MTNNNPWCRQDDLTALVEAVGVYEADDSMPQVGEENNDECWCGVGFVRGV